MTPPKFTAKEFNAFLAFVLVFGLGYWTGRSQTTAFSSSTVINQEKGQPSNVDFSLFWDAWELVDAKHVKKPNDQDRLSGAISGMVSGLGDPFSVYMKKSESERFSEDISGNFDGIGAELIIKDNLVTVVTPLEDSPAQKAGLQPNDIIIKIDDKDAPTSIDEAVKLIRGKRGTEVKLTIVRNGAPQEIKITRDQVEIKSVTYANRDGIGIVKLNQFNNNSTQLLDEALQKAKNDSVNGMVIDLRNNPGGLLDVAVDITSRFIEPGIVVIERDRNSKETELRTQPVDSRVTTPVTVLINKGSASASEIFAGAIQDASRGKVVGETSFGKGSVQSIESLKDGSALRITVAEWLTPKKREINKQGIKPDIEVTVSEDDVKNKRDPQLDKALELLK